MTAHSSAQNAERLLKLSGEVSRIASELAFSLVPPPASPSDGRKAGPDVALETVVAVIRARRIRAEYFADELFAEPAWDMMLDLLQAELSHQRVTVSDLCTASAVPATTALRWIKTMVAKGLFVRLSDPRDARRVFVELTPDTSDALRRYFAQMTVSASFAPQVFGE